MPHTIAIIGAGPSGLAAARALDKAGIRYVGFESADDVGGLWNIDNPRSTMYESAHLISSRTTTQFRELPMNTTADYPGHRELKRYFRAFSDRFDLGQKFRFNTTVERLEPAETGGWTVTSRASSSVKTHSADSDSDGGMNGEVTPVTEHFDSVILANGTLAHPSIPTFAGTFSGEIIHSSQYKKASSFAGKRVLVVGAGNSGCDIAVDAVHHADSIDLSVRRGYYFVPRYLFGKPADTLNQGRPLPARLKQFVDARVLKAFTGDPVKFGFPRPDYRIYESHPIVNTLVLGHLGQGDLRVVPAPERFDGNTVYFTDGAEADYDLIVLATGYTLDYPFVDREHLNWSGMAPDLYLNIFPPSFNGLYVMGMIEASGIGWQGRYEQAELLASYISAQENAPRAAAHFRATAEQPWPDLTGGYKYLALERMSYYVNKDAYRRAMRRVRESLTRKANS
ncbi:monooxygenase domain protein [marine actinobacterium PHSC20C1]|nr:monooxygenase domain protein [marine actinobacterium PHSC20C1]